MSGLHTPGGIFCGVAIVVGLGAGIDGWRRGAEASAGAARQRTLPVRVVVSVRPAVPALPRAGSEGARPGLAVGPDADGTERAAGSDGLPAVAMAPDGGVAVDIGSAWLAAAVAERLQAANDPGDAARLAVIYRATEETRVAARLLAEPWAASDQPELRARGILVLAGIDAVGGADRWCDAAAGDPDPVVRATLLAHPPLSGGRAQDARFVDALLAQARAPAPTELRLAALGGLAAALPADEAVRLAPLAEADSCPSVRNEAARLRARLAAAGAGDAASGAGALDGPTDDARKS